MDFMVALLLVLIAAWLGGLIANRLGYPSMLGELTIGIICGPPWLGILPGVEEVAGLKTLADVGILLMMLYIGMEVDPAHMMKSSKSAIMAAIGGFVVPFAMGFALIYWTMRVNPGTDPQFEIHRIAAGVFVGLAMGVTSLATKSRILLELKLLDTRIAMVMMAGALLSDTAALVIFAGVMGFAEGGVIDAGALALVAVKAVIFFAIAIFLGAVCFRHLFRLAKRLGVNDKLGTFVVLLLVALAFGELAHVLGLHGILGAFLAGMFAKRGVPERREFAELTEMVHGVSMSFLAPIFFVTAGFAFDLKVFTTDLWLLVVVVLIAMVGKIIGTMVFYMPTGASWREAFTVGIGMNDRGAVEIIVAGIALEHGLISKTIFSILVFTALFTTALVPMTLKACAAWLERRGELDRLHERKGLMLIGGGPLARLIGRHMQRTLQVTLVDRNESNCELARAEGLNAVAGNALEADILGDAGALETGLLVALTPNPEVNLMTYQLANREFLVPLGLALLPAGRHDHYGSFTATEGAGMLCSTAADPGYWDRLISLNQIREDRLTIDKEETAEALSQRVGGFPLIMWREGTPRLLSLSMPLLPGDEVLVLQPSRGETPTEDRFDQLVRAARILDLNSSSAEPLDRIGFFAIAARELAPLVDLPVADLADSFEQREMESGTVLGNGLAIPHVLLPGTARFYMLIVRSVGGIRFDDASTVHTVFVLLGTRDERNTHLRCLSAIAQIVQPDTFAVRWQQAPDPESLRALVLKAQRQRR